MPSSRMNRSVLPLAPVLLAAWAAALPSPSAAAGPTLVERLTSDPQADPSAVVEGDAAARLQYLAGEAPRFPGDRPGTLRVLYDTTLPAARLSWPLGTVLSAADPFEFGAVLTIRSDGFFADPAGFSQIAFGLWNGHTTGLDRTGFPSDAYDLVEFDYFPNVGEFGGPFLSPTVFGGNVGDNAFFNFTFASAEIALPLDVPLLCHGVYDPETRRLTVSVARHTTGTTFAPIPGASVTLDASTLDPGFLLDSLGLAGYDEGFASLHAVVDYDLLFAGPIPAPLRLARGARAPRPAAAAPRSAPAQP